MIDKTSLRNPDAARQTMILTMLNKQINKYSAKHERNFEAISFFFFSLIFSLLSGFLLVISKKADDVKRHRIFHNQNRNP